ncbi:hypothetical protein L6164_026327 [Bauhinia variegata]|uniref:Uncharacterized protein n=1 Tax=Bauhinia variegata TaxID=167791 RepID=A0ACB9LQ43_BAUVA|nr:hypothetical protein L6164_026327 [Bauhinia variegata]
MSQRDEVDVDMDDRPEDMIRDIGAESFEESHVFDKLCSNADKPSHPRCTKFTWLLGVLRCGVLDIYHNKSFKIRTMIFYTINEFF